MLSISSISPGCISRVTPSSRLFAAPCGAEYSRKKKQQCSENRADWGRHVVAPSSRAIWRLALACVIRLS
eukprot:1626165-Pyramimonas_sp.AAC.1